MRSVIPGRGDVREFSDRGGNHNERRNCSAKSCGGPSHSLRRELFVLRGVNLGRVVGGVEPVGGYVEDPYPVEVDKQMGDRTSLEVGLEKDLVPVHLTEVHPALRRWDVDETRLRRKVRNETRHKNIEHTLSRRTILAMPSGYQNS